MLKVNYRKTDTSLEKAFDIYNKLVTMKPVHASPTEHQATPMENIFGEDYVKHGNSSTKSVTHNDIKGNGWSANFCGWIQYRQLIPDNVCNNFVKDEHEIQLKYCTCRNSTDFPNFRLWRI